MSADLRLVPEALGHLRPALQTRKGKGRLRFLLVPGLVPDGPETFLRQRKLLRHFGSSTTVTFPYPGFCLDTLLAELTAFLRRADEERAAPVLVGVSVGGGFCLELLRRAREAGAELPLAGLVLLSPVTCAEDLSPLLRRLLAPIFNGGGHGGPERALEKGRSFFKSLARARPLVPELLEAVAESAIRARIARTLEAIPTQGGIERCRALQRLGGLPQAPRRPLSHAPTLILWGSKERNTLDMDGPGTGVLCRPDIAARLFPRLEVQWVYTRHGGEVPHASLLTHHRAFNRPLRRFLKRLPD